ncbi:MAG TPA: hypothetical protein DCL77_08330 [Prolixibacteraceae bacterium]|jgi:hypothetical protein|nr:hypothetical protein [Prolixibacteraceae bacterium]
MKKVKSLLGILLITTIVLIFIQSCKNEVDTTPPAEVTDLSAIVGDSKITISWNDPLEEDLSSIKVTYGDSSINILKGVEKVEIKDLINDQEYNFILSTVDINGNKSNGIKIKAIPEDSRNIYIGNYNFVGYYSTFYQNVNITSDTITYKGSIEKSGNNQLKIIFKYPYKEPVTGVETFPIPIDGLVYVTLGDSGKINYPELVEHSNYYYFSGKFIDKDSIYFQYSVRSHPIFEYNVIRGNKITN